MSPRRIRATRKAQRPKAQDELIELRPGVYLFEPAWAVKARRKSE